MKLHFLGTGAADWDINNPAKDKNYRRYSSLLIDDELLVDPGPCIYEFAETFGYNNLFDNLKVVINTHTHSDHFSEESVSRLNISLTDIDIFSSKETENYIITAYPANHCTAVNPKHYVIESKKDKKRVFYGCDGAWIFYPVYKDLIKSKLDLMIFDGTVGDIKGDFRIFEHNNLAMVEEMCATFSKVCNRFMISHMARTLHTDHETLTNRMAFSNIEVAFDNMIVSV